MSSLAGKKIILGVSGSIAAYKAAYLVRLLIGEGCSVRVLMTSSASDFISPLTMSTLSRHPVAADIHDEGTWNNHVELGLWADVMIIAPATSHTLARCALGLSSDMLSATYLSARCPVFFAPAMDLDMWQHPATIENISRLQSFGNFIIEGFVPFEHVKKMLTTPFNFNGLAMPGMPMDIPDMGFASMPGMAKQTYTTYAFTTDGKEPAVYDTYPSN